jgi:hypothetical protein
MEKRDYSLEETLSEQFLINFGDGPEQLTLRGNSLDFGENKPAVLLSIHERELVQKLVHPLSEPRLAKTIKSRSEVLDRSVRVNDVFNSLKEKLISTPVAEHLISVGHGSGQWYSILFEDSDDERVVFANNGIHEIDATGKSINREKRKEPFYDLLYLLENGVENERHTTNRKKILAGSAAVSITIGTAATVYVLKHIKNNS